MRVELEREVATSQPRLLEVELKQLPKQLRSKLNPEQLQPVYQTQYRRLSWDVAYGASSIEVSLDRGEISAGTKTWPICEVEVELKRGTPNDLFAFSMSLCEQAALALIDESKSTRGARLARGKRAKIRYAAMVKLKRRQRPAEAFSAFAQECLAQYAANRLSFLEGGEAEAVHQMRVALRRMWAVVWMFKPLVGRSTRQQISSILRLLRQQLGPARAAHVFAADVLPLALSKRKDERKLEQGRALAENLVDLRHKALLEMLQAPDHASRVLQLHLLLMNLPRQMEVVKGKPGDLAAFAKRRFERLHQHLMNAADACPPPLSPAFHALRLRLKKQRYLAEIFGQLFKAADVKRHIRRLAKLQLVFGAVNDVCACNAEIETLTDAASNEHDKKIAVEIQRRLSAWRTRLMKREERRQGAVCSKLKHLKTFW
jgi:inorganic triphosphatase YgiF